MATETKKQKESAVAVPEKLDFKVFKTAVQQQFDVMKEHALFVTDVTKHEIWDTYLESFPEGTNEVFRERREYDCQCCKQFIRACGNMVTIIDNKLVSIWDINIGGAYQVVADAMATLVKEKDVNNAFFYFTQKAGTDSNLQLMESGKTMRWNHFCLELPRTVVKNNDEANRVLSDIRTQQEMFIRSMEEINLNSAETVLELIGQKSLYRGEEHKATVNMFIKNKKLYDNVPENEKVNYSWVTSFKLGAASRIKNTVIGTLLIDISSGTSLDNAVRLFESKVAPENYKRPTALVTKGMIEQAEKKVAELGIETALHRRYAVVDDITINNVLFANREAKKAMNVFDEMKKETSVGTKKYSKVEEVGIDDFIKDIMPKAETIEIMFENKHINNLFSLIAPTNPDSQNIFKWSNNFCWSYNGEVADSMKERVKKAGGNVTGVLRYSIQWNDDGDTKDDLDAHCIEPDDNVIWFRNKTIKHPSSGMLDVDIVIPGSDVAVENITWTNKSKMQEGKYKLLVHCYSKHAGKSGFSAEIEYDGQIYSYVYNKPLRPDQKVIVAEIEFSRENGIKFLKSLSSTVATKTVWSLPTQQFHKVTMVMNSPNHWDGLKTGNKHMFFVLENCKNDQETRGFFNEFLNEELTEHRKVFEVLGSKLKVKVTDNQLSGLGFSSTKRDSVLCRLSGSFSRTIKINF